MGSSQLTLAPSVDRLARTAALDGDVSHVRFVSGERLDALHHLGIATLRDLLLWLPRRYLDFSHVTTISHADVAPNAPWWAWWTKWSSSAPGPVSP